MPRVVLSARVHPLVKQAILERCRAIKRKPGYMIETLVIEAEKANLPPGMEPGQVVEGDKVNDANAPDGNEL